MFFLEHVKTSDDSGHLGRLQPDHFKKKLAFDLCSIIYNVRIMVFQLNLKNYTHDDPEVDSSPCRTDDHGFGYIGYNL